MIFLQAESTHKRTIIQRQPSLVPQITFAESLGEMFDRDTRHQETIKRDPSWSRTRFGALGWSITFLELFDKVDR